MFRRETKLIGWGLFMLGVLAAVLLPTSSVQARVNKGVMFGWSRTDWDYEIPNIQSGDIFAAKNGFQAGVFLAASVAPELSLSSEVLYVRKGAKQTLTAVSETGESLGEYDLFSNADYLQVPVLLNYALLNEGGMRPVLIAGPYAAFKLSAQNEGDLPVLEPNKTIKDDIPDFSSTDFGFVLGGGLEFSRGGRTFRLQVRYDLGLTDVNLSARNQAWTIMTGIGF